MVALRKPVFTRMTVPEFLAWQPEEFRDHRWQLADGEPLCMAPASENHGAIQNEAGRLIGNHLVETGSSCRVITEPGILPRVRSDSNFRIPDLGVTCSGPSDGYVVNAPVLLIEILSPSNETQTRANVWAYATIPSVLDILLLSSSEVKAELLSREPGGAWPESALMLGPGHDVELASIGLITPLRAFYRTTSLPRG